MPSETTTNSKSKKTTRNQNIFGTSLEPWTSLCFSKLKGWLWTSLDFGYSGDGLCTQGCQSSLNLCELLGTSWNTGTRQWAESVSDCFWVQRNMLTNTKNGTEIATIRNPLTLTYRSNISYHITTYHNRSKAMQSYAELCAIKSFLVTNFGLWIQSLSNYRCAKNVPRLPPSHRCGPGRGVGRRAATSPDPRFCTSAFRSVDSSQTFQPFSQHRDSIPVPIDHLPNKVHPVHRWAAKI